MSRFNQWKEWARALRREIWALYLAYRDPRTPWYAKLVAGLVAAYALSPIDLIPDPIPIVGYLDDLILLPLGVMLARKLIPSAVLEDCRRRAELEPESATTNWLAAVIIVFIWMLTLAGLVHLLIHNQGTKL